MTHIGLNVLEVSGPGKPTVELKLAPRIKLYNETDSLLLSLSVSVVKHKCQSI